MICKMKNSKKMMSAALCIFALTGCMAKKKIPAETAESTAADQLPTPFHETDSKEEAEKEIGFSIRIPDTDAVEHAVSQEFLVFNDHTLLDVIYLDADGNEVLSIRKAVQKEDVSCDYNVYEEKKNLTAGDLSVTAEENDGTVYTAEWNDGTYGYSLHTDEDIDEDTVIKLVGEIGSLQEIIWKTGRLSICTSSVMKQLQLKQLINTAVYASIQHSVLFPMRKHRNVSMIHGSEHGIRFLLSGRSA